MCLRVEKGPIVLEKDLEVFKILAEGANTSAYQAFKYHRNKKYVLQGGLQPCGVLNKSIIYEGFHAYLSRRYAYSEARTLAVRKAKVVSFRIPKGATVYYGDNRDVVSDIIISGDLKP